MIFYKPLVILFDYLCPMAKEKKKRADQYEKPLAVKGSFLDVVNSSLGIKKDLPKKQVKKAKKD